MSATPQMLTKLATAAKMRAEGSSWAQVAEVFKLANDRVRNWPREHREEWGDLYQSAHDDVVLEAEAEAWHTQRHLLRSAKSESVRQSAAHSIMTIAQKTRPVKQQVEHSGSVELQWVGGLTEVYSDGE